MIVALCVIAILLIVHHIMIHPDYPFPDRAFQLSDVNNHETYVIAALVSALTLAFQEKWFAQKAIEHWYL